MRRIAVAVALCSVLGAGMGSAFAAEPRPLFDPAQAEMIDLGRPLGTDTLYWPTSPSGFELKTLAHGQTAGGYFYSANTFCAPEHGGTHLDAPVHFNEAGHSVDQVPLQRLIAPAVRIDVSVQASKDADYRLSLADVDAFEKAHGRIPAGSIVLLRTGWDARWPDRLRYFGDATPGDAAHLHFPSFGAEAAQRLIQERHVAAIGLDTASIDYGPSSDFPVHRLAGAANVVGLENLAHLERVPPTGAVVIALPMDIAGGSGGPLRIVALLPKR